MAKYDGKPQGNGQKVNNMAKLMKLITKYKEVH